MRALGALNISVGTSLAFEGAAKIQLLQSDSLLINLRTIARNAREAYDKDDSDGKDVDLLTAAASDDLIGLIKTVQGWMGQKTINLIVYLPSYRSLPKIFKRANLWEPTTDIQKEKDRLDTAVLNNLKKRFGANIKETDVNLPEFIGNGLILTHHPIDLVMTGSGTRLRLIESYTGTLKGHSQWYTKFSGGEKLFNIPLNKLTIQIFGDGPVNFKSEKSHKLKDLIKDIAIKGRWTSVTTLDAVRSSINVHAKGFDRDGLLILLNGG